MTVHKKTTAFLSMFDDSPAFRVLDFLVVNDDFDYSMRNIADLSGVGYATLKLFWPRLEKSGVVIKIREIGKAKLYKLNETNQMVKKFKDFYWETTKQRVHQELKVKVVV